MQALPDGVAVMMTASTLEAAARLLGAFPMGVSCIGCERLDLDRRIAFRPGMAA